MYVLEQGVQCVLPHYLQVTSWSLCRVILNTNSYMISLTPHAQVIVHAYHLKPTTKWIVSGSSSQPPLA